MWIAGEYRGATVTLAAEISAQDVAGHAELSLFTVTHTEDRSRDRAVFPAPRGHQPGAGPARPPGLRQDHHRQQRLDQVPDHRAGPRRRRHMGFELTLAGPGKVRLRHVELTRARHDQDQQRPTGVEMPGITRVARVPYCPR